MTVGIETILVLLLMTNVALLGMSRLGACILMVALQGVLLGVLTLLSHVSVHTLLVGLGSIALKGVVFPWLLGRALRQAEVRREVEPFVGYNLSIVVGAAIVALSFWIGSRLPLAFSVVSPVVVATAFCMLLTGFFLIVARKKALTQVLGYLVLENGIFAFGVAFAPEAPLVVELGIFLDLFVAVFVMGIAIFHISREFDHIDTEQLSLLRDWRQGGDQRD
jgi:hydrogenase-4 component E